MCMMCEEEYMYQAYLGYLARKAQEGGEGLTAEEKAFLEASGLSIEPAPAATNFVCDPVPEADAAPEPSPFSRMGPKAS
jgi:hypothetical protein